MKNSLFLILSLVLLAVVVVVTVQNAMLVSFRFLWWNVPVSFALLLLITLAFGIVLAVLVLLPVIIHRDKKIRVLEKELKYIREN